MLSGRNKKKSNQKSHITYYILHVKYTEPSSDLFLRCVSFSFSFFISKPLLRLRSYCYLLPSLLFLLLHGQHKFYCFLEDIQCSNTFYVLKCCKTQHTAHRIYLYANFVRAFCCITRIQRNFFPVCNKFDRFGSRLQLKSQTVLFSMCLKVGKCLKKNKQKE